MSTTAHGPHPSLLANSELLSAEEERALIIHWKATKDPKAADRITRSMMRYIVSVAARSRRSNTDLADVVAQGVVGMLHALDRYEPERNVRFLTFASYWIAHEIQAHVTKSQSVVQLGKRSRRFQKLRREQRRVTAQHGEGSQARQVLAERLGVEQKELELLIEMERMRDVSMDAPASDGASSSFGEMLPAGDASPEADVMVRLGRQDIKSSVTEALGALDERERFVVEKRLMADSEDSMSLEEIGQVLSVCRERVRQLEVRAKQKLRRKLQGDWRGWMQDHLHAASTEPAAGAAAA